MLDAMAGYDQADNDRIKALALIVRRATTKLWNTQVVEEDRLTEEALWPLPWDKIEEGAGEKPNTEELNKNADLQAEYLIKHFPDNGNSNNKS